MARFIAGLIMSLVLVLTVFAGCTQPEAAAPAAPAAGQVEAGVIKVGIAAPLKFSAGDHQWKGASMAVEEINAAGGFMVGNKKYTMEAIKADSNCYLSVTDAAAAVEKLITVDKADFVLGGQRTEAVLAEMEVAMDHKTIYFGISMSDAPNKQLLKDYERYKYFFNPPLCIGTDAPKVMLAIVNGSITATQKALGSNDTDKRLKVALIMEKAVWADYYLAMAKKILPSMGCDIVGEWRPSPQTTDVSAEFAAIKNAGAQYVFDVFSSDGGIAVSRQWGETKFPAVLAGNNAIAMKRTHWDTTNGFCNYEGYFDWASRVGISPKTIPFYDAFLKKYDDAPTWSAYGAYDTMYIIKRVVEIAGGLDTDKLITALENLEMEGVCAPTVAFHPKTHPTMPHANIYGPGYTTGVGIQWRDGKQVPFWPDGNELPQAILDTGLLPGWDKIRYEGTSPFQVPPWVVEYWKGK